MAKVFDASAIINLAHFKNAFSVPQVLDEVRSDEARARLENGMAAGKLNFREPGADSLKVVREKAAETGDNLSETDIHLLALALELKAVLVTDDYGMQNLARGLGIRYEGIQETGIKREFIWRKYCFACKRFTNEDVCEVCGAETRRKVVRS